MLCQSLPAFQHMTVFILMIAETLWVLTLNSLALTEFFVFLPSGLYIHLPTSVPKLLFELIPCVRYFFLKDSAEVIFIKIFQTESTRDMFINLRDLKLFSLF